MWNKRLRTLNQCNNKEEFYISLSILKRRKDRVSQCICLSANTKHSTRRVCEIMVAETSYPNISEFLFDSSQCVRVVMLSSPSSYTNAHDPHNHCVWKPIVSPRYISIDRLVLHMHWMIGWVCLCVCVYAEGKSHIPFIFISWLL